MTAAETMNRMTISEDIEYLRRKWREGAFDKSTGLDAAGTLAEWRRIVSDRGDEPWVILTRLKTIFG